MKSGSGCCLLTGSYLYNPPPPKDEQEATGSLAAATDMSIDAAVVAYLSKIGGIFVLKEEEKTALEGFSLRTTCFHSQLS